VNLSDWDYTLQGAATTDMQSADYLQSRSPDIAAHMRQQAEALLALKQAIDESPNAPTQQLRDAEAQLDAALNWTCP
jgi:hypothetical protein